MERKYKLVERKWGVKVFCGDTLCALIDTEFAKKCGYESAMDYCRYVFPI